MTCRPDAGAKYLTAGLEESTIKDYLSALFTVVCISHKIHYRTLRF